MESFDAKFAAPWSLWRFLDFWNDAVHVIATVAVVAKQKLKKQQNTFKFLIVDMIRGQFHEKVAQLFKLYSEALTKL